LGFMAWIKVTSICKISSTFWVHLAKRVQALS